jgi:aromatic ring-opening dioxygenase catalytic subunit (LigB family)
VSGDQDHRLNTIREIRDGIKEKMQEFQSWVESDEQSSLSQQWMFK